MQDLRECRDQRRRITEEIRGLKKRIKTLSVQIPKLSMEITGCDTTREELNKRIPELRAQCTLSDTDSTKLIDLNGRVKKCREDMSSCASLASELETDVKRLQKAILDAGGSRLKKQQKLCKKTLESLNETTKNLNSTKVQLNSSNKAIENAKKAKESCTQDLEKSKTMLQEKKDEFKKLEDEALEVMQAYEEVQNIESEKKEALVAVSKECEALKKIQSNIKCIEVDMMSKLDNCEKSINELIKRMKHWEDQIQRVCKAEEQDDDYDQSDEEEGEDEGEDSEDQTEDMEEDDGENEEKKVSQPNERRERETPLPVFQQNALEQYDRNEVKEDIAMLEKERDSIAKNANMAAIAEYKKKENDYLSR
jgi:structural maintenance of chromosome 4